MSKENDARHIQSTADNTSAIYVRRDGKWHLHCIINHFDNDPWEHPWPRTATKEEMVSWKQNCITHLVKMEEGR